jgi:hypothetical protein
VSGNEDITSRSFAKWPLKSEFDLGGMLTDCGAKYWMQLGVRHERSASSENVAKALMNDCAVVSLAEEVVSVVMIFMVPLVF